MLSLVSWGLKHTRSVRLKPDHFSTRKMFLSIWSLRWILVYNIVWTMSTPSSTFSAYLGFLQDHVCSTHYSLLTHYTVVFVVIYHTRIICSRKRWNPSSLDVRGGTLKHQVSRWSSSGFHRKSTLRFIPKGYEVPQVLIHLLSRIWRRHGSWLLIWSIATAVMSSSVRPCPCRWTHSWGHDCCGDKPNTQPQPVPPQDTGKRVDQDPGDLRVNSL